MTKAILCRIALPIPLHRQFDYLLPSHFYNNASDDLIGRRVVVPFGAGGSKRIGVIIEVDPESDLPLDKLKSISQLIDSSPLLSSKLWLLLKWASHYYQAPLGDVFSQAIPTLLRQGKEAVFKNDAFWKLTTEPLNINDFVRAKKQHQALELLQKSNLSSSDFKMHAISRTVLKALEDKKVVEEVFALPKMDLDWSANFIESSEKPVLNTEQAIAIASVTSNLNTFKCSLLEGITGSGKTEVYLNIIKPVLEAGKQILIVVPEIGLTPQTVARFKARFNVPIYLKHSGLTPKEQLDTWLHAKNGSGAIVIGTRSAIFSDFKNLGMIILDEEHDQSFKQNDSFKYHARDLAIKRASMEIIPIILGTATPSFETLQNALTGKYQHLHLTERAGNASPPKSSLINLAGLRLKAGLSPQLIELMKVHLEKNNQVILFLNRRGYSPVLMCHECGWLAKCDHCDAFYTYHKSVNFLQCHHCCSTMPLPTQCIKCGSTQLQGTGVGTQQLEETLQSLFPSYPVIRIDRDNTRKKESFDGYLKDINNGKYKILLGTQMLAKGHHFSDVTLVALIDVDGALFCNDFRASERLAQLFTQVSGRAGREKKKGQVVLQTHHPEHSLLQDLINNGYTEFSRSALKERELAELPPFSFQALFRAESVNTEMAQAFLSRVKEVLQNNEIDDSLLFLGPIPSSMERRAGKYRFQLLLQAKDRSVITKRINRVLSALEALPEGRRVKWSIDIDPIDFI